VSQLDILVPHRDALLLAEAIGWLHDYRKCSDEILQGGGSPRPDLRKNAPALSGVFLSVSALSLNESIEQLLHEWKGKADDLSASLLLQYLSRCHNTAHFDKQKPVGGEPDYPIIQVSSPFGFASDIPSELTTKLWGLPWNNLVGYTDSKRSEQRREVENLFSQTVADTRRPINEVDLWSWGLLVGSLYKAALAGVLLRGTTPLARDLRWRLLSIRVNGLDYFLNAYRIPDLLAWKRILSDGLDRVRNLLEVEYPLGSEVYRDENGSLYVVPDVADLLEKTNNKGTDLKALILRAFEQGTLKGNPKLRVGGEMEPNIELESMAWWGQDPNWPNSYNDELPGIGNLLSHIPVLQSKAEETAQFWRNDRVTDICTVCGLHPQGPSQKATVRNVCDICEERRAYRSEKWATSQPNETIWTDEVADNNGRLALIVGHFDLTHWLDGRLVSSLLLIAPHDPENTKGRPVTSKSPSFTRLRRIWETTRRFWKEVQADIFDHLTDDRRRLRIYLDRTPNLGPYHVYDLALGPTDLSVVWVPPNKGKPGYLLSADNLSYIARQLNAEAVIATDPATSAIFLDDFLREQYVENMRAPILRNPDKQETANLLGDLRITGIEHQENAYATAIPILAEPCTFMMIIPASASIGLAQLIKGKYEREMGKVRDRLPLHLGIVYGRRRTPIRALLDAGRAMLDYQARPQKWKVKNRNHLQTDMTLTLERNARQLDWQIPLKMGDGTTDDRWYPYLFLETGGDDKKANEASRRVVKIDWFPFKGHACGWIVHAADLRDSEEVWIWPSTFDFEFLDATARRFEIHYDETGHRPRRTRPFYLEDLDRLETLWGYMGRLSKTQRHQVIHTIETTRETWYGQDHEGKSTTDEVFKRFVADTLAGATWPKEYPWSAIPDEWQEKLIQAGVRGELTDLAELHMEILKE